MGGPNKKSDETLHYILTFLHNEGLYAAEEALLQEMENRFHYSDDTGVSGDGQGMAMSRGIGGASNSSASPTTGARYGEDGGDSLLGMEDLALGPSVHEEEEDAAEVERIQLSEPVSPSDQAHQNRRRRALQVANMAEDVDEYEDEHDPGYVREEVVNQDLFVARELYFHNDERPGYARNAPSPSSASSASSPPPTPPEALAHRSSAGEADAGAELRVSLGEPVEGIDEGVAPGGVGGTAFGERAEGESGDSGGSEVSVTDDNSAADGGLPAVASLNEVAQRRATDNAAATAATEVDGESAPPDLALPDAKDGGTGAGLLDPLSVFGKLFRPGTAGSGADGQAAEGPALSRLDTQGGKEDGNAPESGAGSASSPGRGGAVDDAGFSFPVTPSSKGEPAEPVFPSWPSFKSNELDGAVEGGDCSATERSSPAPTTSQGSPSGSPEASRTAAGLGLGRMPTLAPSGTGRNAVPLGQMPNGTAAGFGGAEGPDTEAAAAAVQEEGAARQGRPKWQPTYALGGGGMPLYEYDESAIEREYEVLQLAIYHRKGATGFEETKDLQLHVGDVVAGRYQVLDFLGSAAFSTAVQAADIKTGALVCLKVVKNNKDYFDQSLDEVKLLRYVNALDPNDEYGLLRLYDYFYFKEHLILVCELLRANLYEFQKFNRESGEPPYFTLPRIQSIAKQVLRSLVFLHSLGLMHCDLKPENILIKSYSRCEVKVIDLGSSCFVTDHLSSYVQSRSYRAPEVVLGLPYDTRIDIWSLGCIFAELVTGYVLFQNDSIPSMLARLEGILGPIPEHMLEKGRYTHRLYTRTGALYERHQRTGLYEVLRPKQTTLAARVPGADALFLDFLHTLLQPDPACRPSAEEALAHPWLSHVYDEGERDALPQSL